MNFLKKVYFLSIIFLLLQVFQIDKSTPKFNPKSEISAPEEVISILKKSCFDCHSYKTNYPFYSYIFPISSFLKNHIDEGREELNFSIWKEYSIEKRNAKLQDIIEEIDSDEMPLFSYRLLHLDSKLNSSEVEIIKNWVKKNNDF